MASLRLLEAEQQSLYVIVQNLYDLSRTVGDSPERRTEFLTRIQTLDRTRDEFTQIVKQINIRKLEIDPECIPSFKPLEMIDELYCHIRYAERSLCQIPKEEVTTRKPDIKLPSLSLISFNGDFKRWPLFYQNFKEIIHDNDRLSDAEKIQYLTSQLTGAALNVISGILPVASNYKIIWKLLTEKFQDPRTLASLYLNSILAFKRIASCDAKNLETFTEQFESAVSALRALDIPDLSDYILTHLALGKLDKETVNAFEQHSRLKKMPKFVDLAQFVREQAKITQRVQNMLTHSTPARSTKVHTLIADDHSQSRLCVAGCNNATHSLYHCPKFKTMEPQSRLKLVKNNKLCYNCLKAHAWGNCNSKFSCLKCNKKHHTMVHLERPNVVVKPKEADGAGSSNQTCLAVNDYTNTYCIVGPTACVNVLTNEGVSTARAILDSGAGSNFLTEAFCKRANLKINYRSASVYGIGETKQKIIGFTNIQMTSRLDSRHRYDVRAAVVKRITGKLPTLNLKLYSYDWLEGASLADEEFNTPGEVDCLLGAGVFSRVLKSRRITSPDTRLVAIETTLGYVVMGEARCVNPSPQISRALLVSDANLDQSLQKLWALEHVQAKRLLSPEEVACEDDFNKNTTRCPDGRYMVCLPFKEDPQVLGDSYRNAKRRFLTLEKKLNANADLREGYDATIREYLERGFLVRVGDTQSSTQSYYIPHRAVYRPEKETSRIRIVLDASCKTSSGKSLNDILHPGPNLQSNIFKLLLNFRLFNVAISADIEKMFFSIMVAPEHRRYQRILYRFQGEGPIEAFEFERVSFGLRVSPYLAMRIVKRLASDEGKNYPEAALVSTKFNYMDDYLVSVPTLEEALALHQQLVKMFASAGFHLTKWISNSAKFMESVPEATRANKSIEFDAIAETKLVGMWWDSSKDEILFKSKGEDASGIFTKRAILSSTAELFDPLGILAPLTSGMKVLIQECWKRGLTWDEEVPADIARVWAQIKEELGFLAKIKIPRHVGAALNEIITILGFADASEKCYGSVVYMRIGPLDITAVKTSFLCAKSRVAPLKKVSLARLELCAAHLLALLMNSVLDNLNSRCKVQNIFAFSDSTVTLAWIHSSPHRWQTFVANRVAAIQEAIAQDRWFFIPGKENPSDLISRPVTPRKLVETQDWFTGPPWILSKQDQWPGASFDKGLAPKDVPEEKTVALVQSTEGEMHPIYNLAERVSKWDTLLRVVTFILRFIKKLNSFGTPTISDLEAAEKYIILCVQRAHFVNEMKNIESGKGCATILRKLNPFIENEILRVGGRLNNAPLVYEHRHPILLPAKDRITHLLVEHFHRENLHTGPGLLLALLRQKYWILAARGFVRKIVHSCNICFKNKPRETRTLMGALPEYRVSQIKPFQRSGVDYAGPILITLAKGRGIKSRKAYICLFVCLATKALHIELVSDLTTEMFLAAFKRFIARRGPVAFILSDGGRNFLGARRRLSEIYSLVESADFNREILRELTPRRIEFKVTPPLTPHFGGLWESNIKNVKAHLYRVVGKQILTYEELNTTLVQIEALLNSRPLYVLSGDPSEPEALTPSHFLNLTPLNYIPAENLDNTPLHQLQRYALIDKLVQSYWRRWHVEYLSTLQTREKWNTVENPVKKGQVVILKEPNLPVLCWPLAIIEEVYPGKDDVVRVVKVKTKSGSYVRSVLRVCPLPTQ